jgi:hypothetical protein
MASTRRPVLQFLRSILQFINLAFPSGLRMPSDFATTYTDGIHQATNFAIPQINLAIYNRTILRRIWLRIAIQFCNNGYGWHPKGDRPILQFLRSI